MTFAAVFTSSVRWFFLFKVLALHKLEAFKGDLRRLRMESESIAPGDKKKLQVEISSHEYCRPKEERELEGFKIYVYTPEMIVCEKLRAICQQMPEYGKIVHSQSLSARARDFFDICILIQHYRIDLSGPSNRELLRCMFEAKMVPLGLLGQIGRYREFHRADFASVEATVKPQVRPREFDYYFDFVLGAVESLQALWEE